MDTLKSYGAQAWSQTTGFLASDGLINQLALTVVIVLVIHFLIVGVESFINAFRKYNRLSATLLPNTYISTGNATKSKIVVSQGEKSKFPFMYPSENELHGIEFSYSFYLYIDPENYATTRTSGESTNSFRTIFYKGAESGPWPIMGPGVFLNKKDNTMRIYMNSINNVDEQYVEVPNIPIGKWFHCVFTQKGQNMDVYINGNIAVRHTFKEIPRINFGSLYVFPNVDTPRSITMPITIESDPMQGMISRVKYYAYAISFSQIDALYGEGASKKIESSSYDHSPPYLHDSWWVTRYSSASSHYGL